MICQTCGVSFRPKHPRGRYCSGKCRVAAWQRRKKQEVAAALDEAERALREVRQVLWRDRGG